MDQDEAQRRNQVMRAFFEGKDWDHNDEFMLKRSLVLRSAELLPSFPFLVDDEWDVVPGQTNHGRGDLVFTDGDENFAVVEVKFIDLARTGGTARAKRTDSRGKVVKQAMDYARHLFARLGPMSRIEAYSFTNEVAVPVLEGMVSVEGAFVTR